MNQNPSLLKSHDSTDNMFKNISLTKISDNNTNPISRKSKGRVFETLTSLERRCL